MKTPIKTIFESFSRGVCHRGLHDLEKPENSKASFEAAIELGLPFECDVNLTKDKRFVVNHDAGLLRVTGKEGDIEKLTLEEIKRDYRLGDGSSLMSIEELLELWSNKVPLVLEIKVKPHQIEDIISNIKPILERIEDKSNIVLISFNSDVLIGLKDTDINVGRLISLNEHKNPDSFDYNDFDFVDAEVRVNAFSKHFHRIKKHMPVLTWTVCSGFRRWLSNRFANAMTFEIVDSSKPTDKLKINHAMKRMVDKYKKVSR